MKTMLLALSLMSVAAAQADTLVCVLADPRPNPCNDGKLILIIDRENHTFELDDRTAGCWIGKRQARGYTSGIGPLDLEGVVRVEGGAFKASLSFEDDSRATLEMEAFRKSQLHCH